MRANPIGAVIAVVMLLVGAIMTAYEKSGKFRSQWLEARRRRGFADGGATTSGASLPVPAASPASDGEKLYAVLTQLLDVNRIQAQQLADMKQWQRDLNARLDLRATQSGLDECKQA